MNFRVFTQPRPFAAVNARLARANAKAYLKTASAELSPMIITKNALKAGFYAVSRCLAYLIFMMLIRLYLYFGKPYRLPVIFFLKTKRKRR